MISFWISLTKVLKLFYLKLVDQSVSAFAVSLPLKLKGRKEKYREEFQDMSNILSDWIIWLIKDIFHSETIARTNRQIYYWAY